MHVTLVHVHVKKERVEDFIEACRKNHEASIKEPGNLRFDVLQSDEDPSRFILYEAYRRSDDAAKHKETSHYKEWRESVADFMVEPRKGIRYRGIFPRGG